MWQDRLREAAYTAPSGARSTFQYEDVSQNITKRTTAFEFPTVDGTYIQDMGRSGRKFPMVMYFAGDTHDIDAAAFMGLLSEPGNGVLEHPAYGKFDVVPFGEITQRDDLKSAANQSVFTVTFWETTGIIYPTQQNDPASQVLGAVDSFNLAQSEQFERNSPLATAIERVTLTSKIESTVKAIDAALAPIAEVQQDTQRAFQAAVDSITLGVDTLVGQPLTLAAQTLTMIQLPARAAAVIQDRLEAYGALAASITQSANNILSPSNNNESENEFQYQDLNVSGYLTGSILSVVNNQFSTRSEALSAAETLLNDLDAANTWRDDNLVSLGVIDTGEAYQQLIDATALAAGFLVEISFTLKQERRIVLDRARTVIDVCAEFYGEIDEQLDFFINSNNLSGSEILELPAGREVVVYV